MGPWVLINARWYYAAPMSFLAIDLSTMAPLDCAGEIRPGQLGMVQFHPGQIVAIEVLQSQIGGRSASLVE